MSSATNRSDVANQIPAIWSTKLFAQAEKMTFWGKFEGPEGSSMPIIRKDDLTKGAGDTVKIDAVLALTGAGLTGDTENGLTEGNEEELKFRQQVVTVDALRHGVRWTKLGKILINHDMRSTALNQLRKWLAGKLDDSVWTALTTLSSYTTAQITGPGGADVTADIVAADTLTLDYLTDLKAVARTQHFIEPITTAEGEELYGLVLHPYAKAALKKSAEWKTAVQNARERGQSNPLFTGAMAMYDGVLLYEADRVPKFNDGGASAPVARNVFFGAAALVRAFAYYPDWSEQYFSYGEEQGIATFVVKGEKLNVFDFSAAGDGSGNRAIGSMLVLSSAPTPTI